MRRRDGESGAAIVEFAIVTSLLMVFLVGILSYGLILGLHQSITHAASEAARSAIGAPGDAATVSAAVEQVAHDRLSWLPADRRALVTADAVAGGCANCVSVTVTYPYAGNELIPSFLPTPDVLSSTAVIDLGDG